MQNVDPELYREAFTVFLKSIMKTHNWTLTELAQDVGISRTALSNWVNGYKWPSMYNIMVIADHFGVTLDEMFGRKVK